MTPPPRPSPLRRLRFVWVFLAAVVVLDVLVRLNAPVWERHSPDGYRERVDGCAKRRREVVFVGGSPVAEGVNPDAIGAVRWRGEELSDVYAVGLSGGTTTDVYFGTVHACPQPPKVLVYGITASDLNDSRHEPHGAEVLLTRSDVADWHRTRPEAADYATRHYWQGRLAEVWAAYHHRHGIRMWAAKAADAVWPGCCPETATEANRQLETAEWLTHGRGYAPTQWFAHRQYDHMKQAGWEQPPFEYLKNYRTGSHLKYLHRLLDWAGANGTAVVLVDMPTTADLEARHPAEFTEFRRMLAVVERERSVPVLRATREAVGLDDSHFADLIHPNLSGANRVSGWLKAELERVGGEPEGSATVRGSSP